VGSDEQPVELSGRIIRSVDITCFSFFGSSSAKVADLVNTWLDVIKTCFTEPCICFFAAEALPGEQEIEEKIFEGSEGIHDLILGCLRKSESRFASF
jgi:galactokinase/mevalonate kinase-like predicted kinase